MNVAMAGQVHDIHRFDQLHRFRELFQVTGFFHVQVHVQGRLLVQVQDLSFFPFIVQFGPTVPRRGRHEYRIQATVRGRRRLLCCPQPAHRRIQHPRIQGQWSPFIGQ